jgi:putative iron-only hydrogenase system regulator
MEKRLGVIAILLTDTSGVHKLNGLLSDYADLMLGRQGIPLREKNVHVISLIVEGSLDRINALTGKIGRIEGAR